MRGWVRFFVFGALAWQAGAQTGPDVGEILRKVGELYKGASQYDLEAEVTSRGTGPGAGAVSHVRYAFQAPNKYRMQGGFPGLNGGDGQNMSETLMIHDGRVLWFYLLELNEYGSLPAGQWSEYAALARYRGAAETAGQAKVLREETMEAADEKTDCYVVAISPVETWWIDRKNYRVMREDRPESSTVFTTIRINERLPDELFRFEPPPGAQKLEPRK